MAPALVSATLAAALLAAAATVFGGDSRIATDAGQGDTPDRRTSAETAPAPAEERRADDEALRQLVAEYDRLYAAIVGNQAVLYHQPEHPLHRQIGELLTPDSPLRLTSIPAGDSQFLAPLESVRAVQFVPSAATGAG